MILELKNIEIGYKRPILKMSSFVIEKGETVFLKGLNGSGKSTLIRTICGLLPAKEGAICIDGEKVTAQSKIALVKSKFSVLLTSVLQANEITVKDYFELHENSLIPLELEKLIDLFSIRDLLNENLNTISDGEKQKVLLVRTLSKDAILYILDEPVTYLDYLSKDVFYNYVLNEKKKTFLISSHDLMDMKRVSSRTVEV